MKRKTQIGLAIVLFLIIGCLVVAFRPTAVPVETASVTRGPLQEVIEEEGKTRMHDHFVVAATVSGNCGGSNSTQATQCTLEMFLPGSIPSLSIHAIQPFFKPGLMER
jgi:hypothetical protein